MIAKSIRPKGSRSWANTLFLANHAATFLLNFVFLIIISQALSAGEFVAFSVLFALANLMVQLSTLGLVPFIIRNFNNRDQRGFDLGWVSRASFLIGLGLAAIALTIAVAFNIVGSDPVLLLLLSAAVVLTAMSNLSSGIFRSARQPLYYLTVSAGQKMILVAILTGCWMWQPSMMNAKLVFLVIAVSTLIGLLMTGLRISPARELEKTTGKKELFRALGFLIPVSLTNFLILLVPFIERSFLAGQFSEIEVAQYIFNFEMGFRVSAGLMIVLKVLVWPSVACGDPTRERQNFYNALRWVLTITGGIVLLTALLAPPYYNDIGVFFGLSPEYLRADFLIAAIAFTMMNVVNYVVVMGVMLTGRTYISMSGAIIFVVVYGILLTPMAAYYGLFGAVGALLSAQVLNGAFTYLANRKAINGHG